MKNYLALPVLLLALAFGSATASAQTIKIGTVDMKKVFESYYKTKDAEAKINEARNAAKKELEDRMDIAKKALEEVKKLDEEIAKPELSKDAKEQKAKIRSEKAGELQNMDREIREFQQSREKQLQEQSVRMRAGIVDEINKVVADRVKAENFDIVFDKSGPSLNGVPIVLYARDSYEFTDAVVTALNKNKGKAAAPEPRHAGHRATSRRKSRNPFHREIHGSRTGRPRGRPVCFRGRRCDGRSAAAAAIADAGEGRRHLFRQRQVSPAAQDIARHGGARAAGFHRDDPARRHPGRKSFPRLRAAAREIRPGPIRFAPGMHPTAVIGRDVVLGENVSDPALRRHRGWCADRREHRHRRARLHRPRGRGSARTASSPRASPSARAA